jgi:hypothetical protein
LDPENREVVKEMNRIKQMKAEENEKEKKLYKKMFKGISEPSDHEDSASTADTVVTTESSFFEKFFLSITQPGVTQEQLKMLNWIFIALFVTILVTILTQGVKESFHFIIFLLIALGLFASVQW